MQKPPSYRYGLIEASHLPEIQKFVDRYWKPGHILARDLPFLTWQFTSPASSRPSILAAWDEAGALAGMQGLIPADFRILDRSFPGAWLGNLFVVPEARKFGVGTWLMHLAHRQGYDVISALGISPEVQALYKRMGYHFIASVPRFIGITDAAACLRFLTTDGLNPPAGSAEFVERFKAEGPIPSASMKTAPLDWGLIGDSAVFRRFSPLAPFVGADRSSSRLVWRYRHAGTFRYEGLAAFSPGDPVPSGICIFRSESVLDGRFSMIRVAEWLCGSEEASRSLASKLFERARGLGAFAVDFFCTYSLFQSLLPRAGLREYRWDQEPVRFPYRLQPPDPETLSLSLAVRIPHGPAQDAAAGNIPWEHLYVTKSDSDQDRPV